MRLKGIFYRIHPAAKIFILILTFVFSISLTMFLGLWVYIIIAGKPIDMQSFNQMAFLNPNDLMALRYSQLLSHLGGFIFPALLFAFFVGKTIQSYLKTNIWPQINSMILAFLIVIAIAPAINYLMEFNNSLTLPESLSGLDNWIRQKEEQAGILTNTLLGVSSVQALIFNIFLIAVIPAIGEEFIFRGIILQIFKDWTKNAHLAIWISAILFSGFHLQFFGFLPRMLLGVLFGYMVYYSGNIWVPVFAHFVNNAAAVLFFYLNHNQITSNNIDNIGTGQNDYWLAIVSALIVFALMFLMRRHELKIRNPYKLN